MPSHTSSVGSAGNAALHTPRKRRRYQEGAAEADDVLLLSPPPMSMLAEAFSSPRNISALLLTDKVVAECIAMLEVQGIARSAMACSAWYRITRGSAFWELAAPRLGLAGRIVQQMEVSRRRSRGILAKGVLMGPRREVVALRTVDLRTANAGYDDGFLPSILREVSLLRSLAEANHPCVVRFIGVQVHGERVHIVTKFVGSSFAEWFAQARPTPPRLRSQIRDRFWQLFRGLSFLHSKGILHRNLTPSNVLLEPATGSVKISDYAHGRSLDNPLRRYSPEAPKLRQQSNRESRRLWYRAPELLLRKPEYGTAIDIWSAGCLLGEAACGAVLFQSDSEIDHLFRVFRFVGTPSPTLWSEGLVCPKFAATFPVYSPVTLKDAARAAAGSLFAYERLKLLTQHRKDVYDMALECGRILGLEGAQLMSSLLHLDPQNRMTSEGALLSPFLRRQSARWINSNTGHSAPTPWRCQLRPRKRTITEAHTEPREMDVSQESQSREATQSQAAASSQGTTQNSSAVTPGTQLAMGVAKIRLAGTPPGSWPGRTVRRVRDRHLSPMSLEDAKFPPLWAEMARLDARLQTSVYSSTSAFQVPLHVRASLVDHMIHVATRVGVSDLALHLGVALLDALSVQHGFMGLDVKLVATVCLKLADSYDEHSFEYFQRIRTQQYVRVTGNLWSDLQIITAEKRVAQKLDFWIRWPTAIWFLRASCEAGGLMTKPDVIDLEATADTCMITLARFIIDLGLFHFELQAHPAPLRAQTALLLAAHIINSRSEGSDENADPFPGWKAVRRETCCSNKRDAGSLCLTQMTHALMSLRGEWRKHGMRAVEERHPEASRRQLPACGFPLSLVDHLVPDCEEAM